MTLSTKTNNPYTNTSAMKEKFVNPNSTRIILQPNEQQFNIITHGKNEKIVTKDL